MVNKKATSPLTKTDKLKKLQQLKELAKKEIDDYLIKTLANSSNKNNHEEKLNKGKKR